VCVCVCVHNNLVGFSLRKSLDQSHCDYDGVPDGDIQHRAQILAFAKLHDCLRSLVEDNYCQRATWASPEEGELRCKSCDIRFTTKHHLYLYAWCNKSAKGRFVVSRPSQNSPVLTTCQTLRGLESEGLDVARARSCHEEEVE
jgi:hypothetical protein